MAQNVQYVRGQVGTRYGHSVVTNPGDIITAFVNWLFNVFGSSRNWFLYYAATVGVRIIDLLAGPGAPTTWVIQTSAFGAAFAFSGNRFYVAFYKSTGAGDSGGFVSSYLGGTQNFFLGPIITACVVTEPGAGGVVTPGSHRFGYLIQSANGFVTRPSPATGGTFTQGFTPTAFTAGNAGQKQLNMSVNAAWPTGASQIQAIMTTTANLNRFYAVPGAFVAVPGGSSSTVNVTINISDSDLAATGLDVTAYQDLLTSDTGQNPPFFPYFIFTYSSRMVYVTLDQSGIPVTYFSEPNNFQYITPDQHGVYLPGNLQVTCGTELRGVAYLFGPHWTYAISDNGEVPVLWAKPQLVDGSIGTLSPHGIYDNTAQGFIWVADVGGLYLFRGGQYPQRPVSYYQQPDWNTINWAAATSLVVIDDTVNRRVSVYAPTGSATTATVAFVWDYADGTEPEQVKYSIKTMAGYLIGSAGIIQNPTTKRSEVWISPGSADRVLRENNGSEANPYRDVQNGGSAVAIAAVHQTSLLPGMEGPHGLLTMHHGNHFRLTGQGNISVAVFALDATVALFSIQFALNPTPGLLYPLRYFAEDEHVSITLATSVLDSYFVLSYLAHYWTPGAPQR